MRRIKIRLFGAFRNLESSGEIEIDLQEGVTTIGALKNQLADHWGSSRGAAAGTSFDVAALLKKSAMANDHEILFDEHALAGQESLAILPPVSGG